MSVKQVETRPRSSVSAAQSPKSTAEAWQTITRAWWFYPVIFLCASLFYFAPFLTFDKIIMGTDDGPRGWFESGSQSHYIQGIFDKWSPLNGGTAIMERRFGRFINPVFPLYYILPKYQARVFEYIFWVFAAGLMMFWFLRTVKISRAVALVGGLGFMFAPALLSHIFPGHFAKMEVIALIPGIMAFAERMLTKFKLIDIVGLPILLALAIYSEHLQAAYFVFWGMGLYFAARMLYAFITRRIPLKDALLRTSGFSAALVIGGLLTAMNTFPSMYNTDVTSKRAGGVTYEYSSSFALHPEEALSFAEPDFVGWKETYWGRNMLKFNSEYFGVIFLILALGLFVIRKQDFAKYLLAILGIGALLFALGPNTPLHRLCYDFMPGIKSFRAPSMMYIWTFFASIALAAFALDELFSKPLTDNKKTQKRLFIFAGIAGAFFLIYLIGAGSIANSMLSGGADSISANQQRSQVLHQYLPRIQTGGFIILLLVAGFFAAAFLRVTAKISRTVFLGIVLCIVLIDAIRISRPFLDQATKPQSVFSRQEKGEASIGQFLLQQDKSLYRVYSMLGDSKLYIPGLNMTYVFDDFTAKQYNDIFQQLQTASYGLTQQEYRDNPIVQLRVRNILSLLNTKYLLSLSDINIPGLQLIVNSGNLRIYLNNSAFPRIYLADSVVAASDPQKELFERFDAPEFSRHLAIVDAAQWKRPELSAAVDSTIAEKIDIAQFDAPHGKIAATVASNREQVLVVGENFSPGWSATINGKPAEVFRVNYAWKGVVVPQGTSKVELTYDSPIAAKWRHVTAITAVLFLLFACIVVAWEIKTATTVKRT
jgi:hypothetical protein